MEKTQVFDVAADLLKEQDYEASVSLNYSGRGMYGKNCVGIVTGAPAVLVGWALVTAIMKLAETQPDPDTYTLEDPDLIDLLPRRTDNMGRDLIYY